jgi:hypothetical protein
MQVHTAKVANLTARRFADALERELQCSHPNPDVLNNAFYTIIHLQRSSEVDESIISRLMVYSNKIKEWRLEMEASRVSLQEKESSDETKLPDPLSIDKVDFDNSEVSTLRPDIVSKSNDLSAQSKKNVFQEVSSGDKIQTLLQEQKVP